jgi:Chitobiase/beta-hexosaminidase C-terminal domain
MRNAALVLAGIVTATAAQGQISLPMTQYMSQVQSMQSMYQMQSPVQIFSAREEMSQMKSETQYMGSSLIDPSKAKPIKIEDESERMAPTPTFSVQSGSYKDAVTVTITDAVPDATIYYTLDGSAPQWDSPVYTGPITIKKSAHLVAIAIPARRLRSYPARASYDIQRDLF